MTEIARPAAAVMWPIVPLERESLMGWITRTAHENVLPSPYSILRRTGLSYTAKPIAALLSIEAAPLLATSLGADQASVEARMLGAGPSSAYVQLNGVPVRRKAVVTNVRRFSPATLGRAKTHLTAWSLRTLPFCSESWEFLQDSCADCGQVQRWRQAQDQRRCDMCNADLTVQRAELVDPALRADLYELCTLAYGTSADGQRVAAGLPQELASLSAGALLEITSLAAGIVDPELRFSFRARTHLGEQQQVVSAHAEAWTLLKGYPDSLGTLAARLGGANATPQARAARGRIRNILDGHARGELLPEVQCLADALRTSDSLNLDRQGDADMRVKPAAWILGATEGEVAAARDAKVLKSRFGFRHGALRSSLDREEIEYLGEVRVDRLAAHSLAGELGLPRYAGEQLLSTATVRRHDHPWLLARYRSAQTTHSDLAAFKASLRNSQVQAEIENPVPLACLMRRIGGGPKPWGTVLGMMAQARLPFRLKDDGTAPNSILVPAANAHQITALGTGEWQEDYTWEDAMDILNLSTKHQEALASLEGQREKGKGWRLSVSDLREKACSFISLGELVARLDKPVPTVTSLVRHKGLGARGLFGWDRKTTEAELSELLL